MSVATSVDFGIESEISAALAHQSHLPHHQVHFQLDSGEIQLQGQVSSYFEKQLIQESIRKIDRRHAIKNQLQVVR